LAKSLLKDFGPCVIDKIITIRLWIINNHTVIDLTPQDAIFHALSDPTRRGVLEQLMRGGEANVARLTETAGVSQPAVSKHLAILRAAGLVTGRAEGREVRYRAEPKALAPLFDWMTFYRAFWDDRIAALEDTLKRMDQ
jgi:DNA-binding transcriptional ArsR family regulator